MKQYTISQAIKILNLNSNKSVSVNYLLVDRFNKLINNLTTTSSNHNDVCCEADCDKCNCKNNINFDCCKTCDMSDECGCYLNSVRRDKFSYYTNTHKINDKETKTLNNLYNHIKYIIKGETL